MDTSPSSHPPKPNSKKSYHHPPKKSSSHTTPPTIQPGDTGIWATCTKGKEGKATVDLLDLFAQFAESLYGIHDNIAPAPAPASSTTSNDTTTLPAGTDSSPPKLDQQGAAEEEEAGDNDIESAITAELLSLRGHPTPSPNHSLTNHPHPPTTTTPLIRSIRLTTPCLLFFRTSPPLDPLVFVTTICRAFASPTVPQRQARFIKRLTPISLIGKATPASLAATAGSVLEKAGMTASTLPPSTTSPAHPPTFAIRPTIREHNVLTRSEVIETVAPLVEAGAGGWRVDLNRPGKVVLVEVWRNVCGVCVVEGGGWEGLKRFNLAELGGKGEGEGGKGEGKGTGEGEGGKRKRDGGDGEEGDSPLGRGEGGEVVDGGGGAEGGGNDGGEKRKRDGGDGEGEERKAGKVGREA